MFISFLKFFALSISVSIFLLFAYSFTSYELIVKDFYINSYVLAGCFTILFLFIHLVCISFAYRQIFQKESRKSFLFLWISLLPIILFSFGLGFLSNIYQQFNYTNYQVTKSGKFVAKNVATMDGTEEEITNKLKTLMDDILIKQGVNPNNLTYSFKLPTKTTNYGDSFIIEVQDKRNFNGWKECTFMPLPKNYTWRFFYNFMNKSETNGNNRVISQVNYSTPYEDFGN